MENLKKVLEKLEFAKMQVHVIDHSNYTGMSAPIALLAMGTHYVVHDDKIVHIGNEHTIESFALRQYNQSLHRTLDA